MKSNIDEQIDIPVETNLEPQPLSPRFTPEEIEEKKQIYKQQIQQIVERNQIAADELADLINSLNNVLAEG